MPLSKAMLVVVINNALLKPYYPAARIWLASPSRCQCDHRHRHGFEVGKKKFFSMPPKFVLCLPNSRGTAGAYHSGKTDIVKITRVKNKALLTWRLADIHNVCATRNLKQNIYILWRIKTFIFVIGLSCTKRTHFCHNLAFVVLNKYVIKTDISISASPK